MLEENWCDSVCFFKISMLNLVNTSVSLMSCSSLIIYIVSVTVELENVKHNQKHVHCSKDLFLITDQQRSANAINHHKKPNNTRNRPSQATLEKSYHNIAELFFPQLFQAWKWVVPCWVQVIQVFWPRVMKRQEQGAWQQNQGSSSWDPFSLWPLTWWMSISVWPLFPANQNVFVEAIQPWARTHTGRHTHCQKPFVIWKTDNRRNGNTENNYTLAWLQPLPEESIHIQPCYPSFPSAIFIMQWWGLGACSVLYLQAETTGEVEEHSSV